MNESVIMPKQDYQLACDTVREITGQTGLIKSGDFVPEVSKIINKIGKAGFKINALPENADGSYWRHCAYGDGKFIATTAHKVYYSTDGVNWTDTAFKPASTVVFLACCHDKFILSTNRDFYISTDGINWNHRDIDLSAKVSVYGNGRYIVSGYCTGTNTDYNYIYSDDGLNWTFGTIASKDLLISAMTFDGEKFIATCSDYMTLTDRVWYTSTDGKTWNKLDVNLEYNYITALCYGHGKYACLAAPDRSSGNTYLMYSSDCINWTMGYAFSQWSTAHHLAFWNGKFIILASYSNNHYSTDCINWNKISSIPSMMQARTVSCSSNCFVACGPPSSWAGEGDVICYYNLNDVGIL